MDLALSFSSPERRNTKFESFSLFKNSSYDNNNALRFDMPMESGSHNSMFDSSGGCRVPRWAFPNFNFNNTSRTAQFNKSGPSIHKVMVPKMPSISISVCQQTVVGGFVGSKSHAGRSLFGDSNQIWDAIICNIVEIMSLEKDSSAVDVPSSKTPSSSNKCYNESTLGVPIEKINHVAPVHNISVSENSISISSKVLNSCFIELSSNAEMATEARQQRQNSPPCLISSTSKPDVPRFHYSGALIKNAQSPQKKTYSSIVDGTCKNGSAKPETCVMVKLKSPKVTSEIPQESSPPPQKQSYADVAKIIPQKLVVHQNKSGCEIPKNVGMWSCKIRGNFNPNKRNMDKKVVRQNKSCRSHHPDDFLSNGYSRWKEDWKFKREKFQKKRPLEMPIKSQSCHVNETGGSGTGDNEVNTKEETFVNEALSSNPKEVTEIPVVECSNKGYRGRYTSECSLDSDDSFVVFEDCSEPTSSSSRQSCDLNSSLEDDRFSDDYSSSSSDDSDSEDDFVDIGLQHAVFDSQQMASSSNKRKFCESENKCTAPTVPESKFKGIQKKTVHFAEGPLLAVVRPMIAWGYAYRESRRGPWEVHARDRVRFRLRIESLAPVLNLILDPHHRGKILATRFPDYGL